jgi:hypothetical protein
MAQTRFTCTLTKADEPACQSYARVTIVDTMTGIAPGHVLATVSPRSTASLALTWAGPTPKASTSGSARPLSWPKNEASSVSQS